MAKRQSKIVLFLGPDDHVRLGEAFFNSVAEKMGLSWRAESRGVAPREHATSAGTNSSPVTNAPESLDRSTTTANTDERSQLTADDFERADRVVVLGGDNDLRLLRERLAGNAEKVEFWHIGSGPDSSALMEREVMGLVARILGGGLPPGEASPEKSPLPEKAAEPARPGKPMTARVGRETAGRRGKGVTTIFDLQLDETGLRELAAQLKQQCGTGGTVKQGRIEIQGDHRDRITAELERLGYKVKRAGG